MAVKENNGLIYGIGKLMFSGKEIGWISQDGLAPAGEDAQTTPIYAAQVPDGPVDELVTSPGTIAFSFTLIQLNAQNCVDLLGGEISEKDGAYEPPEAFTSGVLGFACTVKCLKPTETGKKRYRIIPPQEAVS